MPIQDDPTKFIKPPKMPGYKDKTDGRFVLAYTLQALSRPGLKQGRIQPSHLAISLQTKQTHVSRVRIVPRIGFSVVEVLYEQHEAAPAGPRLSTQR